MFQFIIDNFNEFLTYTGFANASVGNLLMIIVGAVFIYLVRLAALICSTTASSCESVL